MRMNKRGEIRFKQRWCKSLKRSKFKKPKFLKSLFPSRARCTYHGVSVQREMEDTIPRNADVMMDASSMGCSTTISEHQTIEHINEPAESTSEQSHPSGHDMASVQDVAENDSTTPGEDVVGTTLGEDIVGIASSLQDQQDADDEPCRSAQQGNNGDPVAVENVVVDSQDLLENINPQNLSAADSNMPYTDSVESLGELNRYLETEPKYPYNSGLCTPMSCTSLQNSFSEDGGEIFHNNTAMPVLQLAQSIATVETDSGIMSRGLSSQAIESMPLSEASGQDPELTSATSANSEREDVEDDSGFENPYPEDFALSDFAIVNNQNELQFGSNVAQHGSNINSSWPAEPVRNTESQVPIGMPPLAASLEQPTGGAVDDISTDSPTDTRHPEGADVATQGMARAASDFQTVVAQTSPGDSAPTRPALAERPAVLSIDNIPQVPIDAGGSGENRPPPRIEQDTGSVTNDIILHQDEDVTVARGFVVRGLFLRDIDIKRTRRMWRRFRKCATCFRRPRVCINLPCRHLCNCRECSPCMTKCSICQADIVHIVYAHL